MHVVPARVHHRLAVGSRRRARVVQTGRLAHRERVHVGPDQDDGALAAREDPDDTGATDPFVHLEAVGPQPLRDEPGGPVLLVGELGVGV